jgi:hypothetical protein
VEDTDFEQEATETEKSYAIEAKSDRIPESRKKSEFVAKA